jgi:hypothetical protein
VELKLTEAIRLTRGGEPRYTLLEFIEAIHRLGFRLTGNSRVRGISAVAANLDSYLRSLDRDSWNYDANQERASRELRESINEIILSEPLISSNNSRQVNELEECLGELYRLRDSLDTRTDIPAELNDWANRVIQGVAFRSDVPNRNYRVYADSIARH